jgi:hypothetical protein
MGVFMTMSENCEQLQSLVRLKYDKDIEFFALPKTTNSQEIFENEMAVSLIQNKNQRSYYKADSLIIPIFRGNTLDGAVIVKDAGDLEKESRTQITELVELLITEILSLNDELVSLSQKESQLEKQVRLTDVHNVDSMLSNLIH